MADRWWRLLLPSPIRTLPADLATLIGFTALTLGAVFVPWINESLIRIPLGLLFVLFVPGYAFVAALFPSGGRLTKPGEQKDEATSERDEIISREGIDWLERIALSIGTSIAVVPLIGLVLNFTPWGIRLAPIMIAVSGFTLGAVAIAAYRRHTLPPETRLQVPYRDWVVAGKGKFFEPETRSDAALNVIFAVSLILAVGSVGYTVAVPKKGATFTEFYLLTENEDGELIADDYPTNFTVGQSSSLYVGIGNHEHEPVRYTVIVELHRVQLADNSTTVLERQELQRFRTRLVHNETWHHEHTVAPRMQGDRLRLTYLLYKGSPPSNPTTANAYREVHLWVNVSSTNESSESDVSSSITQSR